MFTGIIEAVGVVSALESTAAGLRLRIATSLAPDLAPGSSLAVNGVCLTVVEAAGGEIGADISPETARVTALGALEAGALVNLERALRADARLDGHFVLGHVDATGRIERLVPEGEAYRLTVAFPPSLAPYLVRKGSVAVDGISLTVAALGEHEFDVQIVPYTWEHTSLKAARPQDAVNLECDIIGKYVLRAAELSGQGGRYRTSAAD